MLVTMRTPAPTSHRPWIPPSHASPHKIHNRESATAWIEYPAPDVIAVVAWIITPETPMSAVAAVGVLLFKDQFALDAFGEYVVMVGTALFVTENRQGTVSATLRTCPII